MSSLSKNWNSLLIPAKSVVELDEHNKNSAKIVIEPLERGYGHTVGNALRRILLSSLQGSAITGLRISGVLHEFSSIQGIAEDVTEIVLNLKGVIIKSRGDASKTLKLVAAGPCVVTAGMISEVPGSIEILNRDHVICTLSPDTSIEMELLCTTGKGYVPAVNEGEMGVIAIDALYSPVQKVSYKVENARVGQVTDYDKLVMHIETNGVISPELAVAVAARIMQEQLAPLVTFEEVEEEKTETLDLLPFNPILLKKVEELELSVRSQNCLRNENITYIGDLVIKTESEMLKTPNFGRKSLKEIEEILEHFGLSFGMKIKEWPPENLPELARKYEEPY